MLSTGRVFQKYSKSSSDILATDNHRQEFYRTLTEKLLTYGLGRGLEYYDVGTVDQIVNRLEQEHGRFSALIAGVVQSVPFQRIGNSAILAKSGVQGHFPARDQSKVQR